MTGHLDALVNGELLPGRYRLGAPLSVRVLRDEVAEVGWTTRLVNGAVMHDRASMFDEFSAALEFPEWFGHNWDAFADCLRDLSWLPSAGTVVLWRRSAAFEAAAPRLWQQTGRIIDTAIASRIEADLPPLSVLYPAERLSDGDQSMLRRVQ